MRLTRLHTTKNRFNFSGLRAVLIRFVGLNQYPIVISDIKPLYYGTVFSGTKWLVRHVPKWKYVLSSYFEINEFLRMSLIIDVAALPFMVE